jgi:hypothetical protein
VALGEIVNTVGFVILPVSGSGNSCLSVISCHFNENYLFKGPRNTKSFSIAYCDWIELAMHITCYLLAYFPYFKI